jgi:GGDEF domain-containing protein
MNSITHAGEPRRIQPARSSAIRLQALKTALAWLMLRAPVLVPLALLPLFPALGLLYGGRPGSSIALMMIAPALFYSGFAITLVKRIERRTARHQARLEAEVARRIDEFAPTELRLSRQYFESRLAQEINRSRRHRLPLCVVTLSTPAEREVAVHTSELVELAARALRAEDCAGRLGRNVYAISLPHTTPAGAAVVIERLRQELYGKQARFGLAYLEPGRDATPQQLLDAAISSTSEACAG